MSFTSTHTPSRPFRLAVAGAATATLAAGLTWAALAGGATSAAPAPPGTRDDGVVVAHAADHLPNATATDWVSYADHVVVVTPVAEHEVAPTASELSRGEGLIGRRLDMSVDEVLWSRGGATAVPERFDWQAFGWQFRGGDTADRTPIAAEDAPRFEVGHRYVLAIRWEPARCGGGDRVPARWQGLGADAMVPADGGIIGQGELEGRRRSLGQSQARLAASPSTSLEDRLLGRGVDELRHVLASSRPAPAAAVAAAAPAPDGRSC